MLTGSLCLALSELGDGRSSSENRLAVRFLASSIMGNSSSCSSGSLSASDGEVRVLKLGVCFSMLVQAYWYKCHSDTALCLHMTRIGLVLRAVTTAYRNSKTTKLFLLLCLLCTSRL